MNSLLLRILAKIGMLSYMSFLLRKKFNGKRFNLPINNGRGANHFLQDDETWMAAILRIILADTSGVFIDVGVNLGQTLLQLKSVNPHINYYGFDPNAECISYCHHLCNLNEFKSTALLPVGLSDHLGIKELSFFSKDVTDSSASIVHRFRGASTVSAKQVLTAALDSIISVEKEPIIIIKIDVEGSESQVIKGAEHTILFHRPYIICEILPVYDVSNKQRLDNQNKVVKFMAKNQYTILRIEAGHDTLSLKSIKEIGIHNIIDWCNYLFLPTEKKDFFNPWIT